MSPSRAVAEWARDDPGTPNNPLPTYDVDASVYLH